MRKYHHDEDYNEAQKYHLRSITDKQIKSINSRCLKEQFENQNQKNLWQQVMIKVHEDCWVAERGWGGDSKECTLKRAVKDAKNCCEVDAEQADNVGMMKGVKAACTDLED